MPPAMTQDADQDLSADPPAPDHPEKHAGWLSWLPWWLPVWVIAVTIIGTALVAAAMALVLEYPI